MIKLITFDLDNTLWPVNEVIMRANQKQVQWLNENHPIIHQTLNKEDWLKIRNQLITEQPNIIANLTQLRKQTVQIAAEISGIKPANAKALSEEAFKVVFEERNKVTPFPDAIETLKVLAKDYQLISLTNGNADLKTIGIDKLFDHNINSEQVGKAKPHPAMFNKAFELARTPPSECLHIGDDFVCDVEAANNLGCFTLWANTMKTNKPEELPNSQQANGEFENFNELISCIETLKAKI